MRIPLAMVVAGVLGAALVAGQEPTPQRPVFRGAAMGIYVDVYPTHNGHIVPGLTAGDFEVREDGVLQKIELLDFVHFEISPADSDRRDPTSVEEAERLAGDPRHRAFVVYFDTYHLSAEGARNMRGPVIEFLERTIGPTDYFAALNPDVPPSLLVFGQRTETIAHEVDEYWPRAFTADLINDPDADPNSPAPPMSSHEEWLSQCYLSRSPAFVNALIARWRQELLMKGLAGLVRKLATIREERTNVLIFASGWTLTGPDDTLMRGAWGPQTRTGSIANTPLKPRPVGTPDYQACDAELFRLASVDFQEAFRGLLADARRANVAFSTIDPGGLGTFNRNKTVAATEALLKPLTELASNTGGRSINTTNDLRTPLQEMANDVSAYYLLGYYTSNTTLDGKYRKIQVKSRRKDVKIVARDGYLGPTAVAMRSGTTDASVPGGGPAPVSIDGALNELARLDGSSRLFLSADASATAGEVTVVAEIAGSESARWSRGGDVSCGSRI